MSKTFNSHNMKVFRDNGNRELELVGEVKHGTITFNQPIVVKPGESQIFTMEEFMDKLVTEHNFKWERLPDGSSRVTHKEEKVVKRDGHTYLVTKEYGLKEMTEEMLQKAIQHGFNMALDRVKEIENVIRAKNLTISVDEVLALPVREFFLWLSKHRISFVTNIPIEEVPKEVPSNPEEPKKEEVKNKKYRLVCNPHSVNLCVPVWIWSVNPQGLFTVGTKDTAKIYNSESEALADLQIIKTNDKYNVIYYKWPELEEVIEPKTKKYRLYCKSLTTINSPSFIYFTDAQGSYELVTEDKATIYPNVQTAQMGLNLIAKKWVETKARSFPVIQEFEV